MSNTVRKIKNIYIGTENDIKEIKKGWIGINNIPKLFFMKSNEEESSTKILPDGYKQVKYIFYDGLKKMSIDTKIIGLVPVDLSYSIVKREDTTDPLATCVIGASTFRGNNADDYEYSWGCLGIQSSYGDSYFSKYQIKNFFTDETAHKENFDEKITFTNISKSSQEKYYSIFNEKISYSEINKNYMALANGQLISSTRNYPNTGFGYIHIFDGLMYSTLQKYNGYNAAIKLYSCKIYNDITRHTLIRNFIPCIKEENNTPGLFDLIQKDFYENSHPNSEGIKFIAGPEV